MDDASLIHRKGQAEPSSSVAAPVRQARPRRNYPGPPRHQSLYPRTGGIVDWIDLLQWPAMVATVIAAWLIGSL